MCTYIICWPDKKTSESRQYDEGKTDHDIEKIPCMVAFKLASFLVFYEISPLPHHYVVKNSVNIQPLSATSVQNPCRWVPFEHLQNPYLPLLYSERKIYRNALYCIIMYNILSSNPH